MQSKKPNLRAFGRALNSSASLLTLVIATAFVSACRSDAVLTPRDGPSFTLSDASALTGRVTRAGRVALPVAAPAPTSNVAPGGIAFQAAPPPNFLQLVAEVAPPNLAGSPLQATHADFQNGFAYVSYGRAAATDVGAIDVFDMSDPSTPLLVSEALFPTTKINAIAVIGNSLYYAGGTDDATISGAVVGEITLSGGKLTNTTRRLAMPSYTATGVSASAASLFVTSGSGGPQTGGMTLVNRLAMSRGVTDAFLDARASAVSPAAGLAMQGGPGRLRMYDPLTGSLLSTVNVGGASVAASKATVSVNGDFAFVATGDGGTRVVSISRRAVVDSLPRPSAPGVGAADAVTNSVSVLGGLVFTANGGAGVAVAQAATVPPVSGGLGLKNMGTIVFPGPVSSNYAVVDPGSGMLFVASGRGGLKIVQVLLPPWN